jgi:hypothetical protein
VVREFRVDQAELKAGWNPFGLALRLQRVKPDERALLRQTLIDELGNLAAQIQGAVEILAQADQTDQELPVLIILDDLDKCEAGQVIEVFDRYARQLAGLPCRLLATVPLDLYLCEQHLRIASYFPNVIYLPLIRPTQPDGSEDPRGLADLEAMFRKRVEDVGVVVEELIEAESLRALSIASGGLPRQLMRLGQECLVRLAIAPDATKITVPIVQEAISDVADAFAIVRVDAELSTDLRRVRDCEDKHVPPLSRDRLCELLSLLYVLQYGDGETWYDVNPFVSPLL